MKKIGLFFIILFWPAVIFGYSNRVLLGGENVGININSKGLTVTGFYKVNGKYIGKENLRNGDVILSVNDIEVNSIDDLSNKIGDNVGSEIKVKIRRNNKIIDTYINVVLDGKVYKTGLYIKDNIVGIGTITYIDPISKIYGALGHEIMYSETNSRVEVRNGNILESRVTSIDKSYNGYVGAKNANINFNKSIGTIESNTDFGIFGIIDKIPDKEIISVGDYDDIHKGEALIYTVTNGSAPIKYKIKIVDKYNNKKNTNKAFGFQIDDEELLNITGGVVQGMSGSPIVQDNKIIGAVTHVVVDRVNLGYGVYIGTMLKEGDKIK